MHDHICKVLMQATAEVDRHESGLFEKHSRAARRLCEGVGGTDHRMLGVVLHSGRSPSLDVFVNTAEELTVTSKISLEVKNGRMRRCMRYIWFGRKRTSEHHTCGA